MTKIVQKMARKPANPGQYVHDPSTQDFLRSFVGSREFQDATLRQILRRARKPRGADKAEAAENVADAYTSGDLTSLDIVVPWVQQPRKWLAFRIGKPRSPNLAELIDPDRLLGEFMPDDVPSESWYGPIQDDEDDEGRTWLVKPVKVPHWLGGVGRPIRWHLIAEIGRDYVALHWDGFSHTPAAERTSATRFGYWKYIRPAWDQLAPLIPGKYTEPDLEHLVLNRLWKQYVDAEGFNWRHERVNGTARGINLSARASSGQAPVKGGAKRQMQDLTGFSRTIAKNILAATGNATPDDALLKRAENAGTYTMVHQWSPRSFEFSLRHAVEPGEKEAKEDRLCRAHVYFGNGPQMVARDDDDDAEPDDPNRSPLDTEWSVQHVECYQSYGHSAGALRFLLDALRTTKTAG